MNRKNEMLLISYLRRNSREQLTDIGRKTGIPISTLFDMLGKTTKIVKNTCVLDFMSMGYSIRATIVLKVDVGQREDLKNFLLKHPNLNCLQKINNGYDFMLEVVYKELKDLEGFTDCLDKKFNIIEKKVYYVIEDIARERFLSDPKMLTMFEM